MLRNRSIPAAAVIPELAYRDLAEAADWLCRAFGFSVRLRVGSHRVQLNEGDGAVVLVELGGDGAGAVDGVMVRIDDLDAHFLRAVQNGARVIREPATYPYGERQYSVEDFAERRWTFSESVADVDPREWGGEAVRL